MSTDCLFREDSYLKDCSATVVGLIDAGGVMLDRTVFYPASGGQPADRGVLTTATGDTIAIANASYTDPAKTEIAHLPAATTGLNLKIGETVRAAIDWDLRYARMRMHTALHLLSAVLPYPVTGGAVGDADGRLDFDIPEAGLHKGEITRKLAAMIASRAEVRSRWITDAELEAAPGLVRPCRSSRRSAPDASGSSRSSDTTCSPAAAPTCIRRARSATCASRRSKRRASRTGGCGLRLRSD